MLFLFVYEKQNLKFAILEQEMDLGVASFIFVYPLFQI